MAQFKEHEQFEEYFERLDKCKSIPDLRTLTNEFSHAILKQKNEGEYPLKYAELEADRIQDLTLLNQRWQVEYKQKEHTLVDAYSNEYSGAMDKFDERLNAQVDAMTDLLNQLYTMVNDCMDDQLDVAQMAKDMEVYRYRNYHVDGRKMDGLKLPWGVLGIDGDNVTDRNRKAFLAIAYKYLELRTPLEPIPEGVLSKINPDPMYFHQGQ